MILRKRGRNTLRLPDFIRSHPLATVLAIAVLLRLVAVLFSKGFMASDDHYETVSVAYNWLRNGAFNDSGHLIWGSHASDDIARFPLYNLLLYGIMKVNSFFGIESLDKMMYSVRAVHALLSLISVWALYRITRMVTWSTNWAVAAGLVAAVHFAMPYLAVRNLIEMVGGHLFILAVYLLYLYRGKHEDRWLVLAGVVTGLAWMIRFQIAFAVLPIPLVLWYDHRRLKPAVVFCTAVFSMIVIAGFVDWWLLGKFMGSTVNHLRQALAEGTVYETSVFIYPAVLLAFFIPPFSLLALYMALKKRFWTEHKIICFSALSFILLHAVVESRQERYMIPIVPVIMLIVILVLYQHYRQDGFWFKHRGMMQGVVGFTLVVNALLLIPFCFNYSHRGLVEPLARIEQSDPAHSHITFVTSDAARIFPLDYGGLTLPGRRYIRSWTDLPDSSARTDYYFLYPNSAEDLPADIDSINLHIGKIRPSFHVGPSLVDYILHALNHRNKTHEVWVFEPKG